MNFIFAQKASPFPAIILSGMGNNAPFSIYGHFPSPPKGTISSKNANIGKINYTIQEVL